MGLTTRAIKALFGSLSDDSAAREIVAAINSHDRRAVRRAATCGLPMLTNRVGNLGSGSYSVVGTDTSMTSKLAHRCPSGISCIRLIYPNWNLNSGLIETDSGNAITIKSSIEYPSGTKLRVFFGGKDSVTISPGGQVISDPLFVNIPANTRFWTNCYVSVADNTMKWYCNYTTINSDAEASNIQLSGGDGTDQTAPGTVTLPDFSSSHFCYGPAAIAGSTTGIGPDPVCVGSIGDSIMAGAGRTTGAVGNVGSWFERGMGGNAPTVARIGLGQSTSKMSDAVTTLSGARNRFALLSACDYIVCGWGINDLGTGGTLAPLQANALIVWKYFADQGIRVLQTTLTPYTTSTDSWATTANQSIKTVEPYRVGFNRWIRDGAPIANGVATTPGNSAALRIGQAGHPLWGMIDAASKVEVDASGRSAFDGGRWSVGNVYLTDTAGLHPNDAGHTLIGTAIDPSIFVPF